MGCLPKHGRIDCTVCYKAGPVIFDESTQAEDGWRITANPLAWGNSNAEIIVLGFSKGPTQAGALASKPHDEIAYKGSRLNVGKILAHVGLLPNEDSESTKKTVDRAISDNNGRFHFGSLIRCTVERYDAKSEKWKGSGGGMLDKFVGTQFGTDIAQQCTTKFLRKLPANTKLVIMFGLGTKLNYVKEAFKLFQKARLGKWKWINSVSYQDEEITVVHLEHFASQGALIPNWMGKNNHERGRLGEMAISAVKIAMARS